MAVPVDMSREMTGAPHPAALGSALVLVILSGPALGEPAPASRGIMDATEVRVSDFARFADETGRITTAEAEGGGYEFVGRWQKRAGWSFRRPDGRPADPDAPAVHVTHAEAAAYCAWAGGRLPTGAEWRSHAYTEMREVPGDGFVRGRTYLYPVGDNADGLNTHGSDPWPSAAPAGQTRRGVNGLYDMGGNVWEWTADRSGPDALTAGGSWWYGPDKALADAAQWKPADFFALYVGFRCIRDRRP